MRVIPINLTNKDLRKKLSEIRTSFRIPDVGYVEDLFCLILRKGYAIPTEAATRAICDKQAKNGLSVSSVRIAGLARRKALMRLVATTAFQATYADSDPLSALHHFLSVCQQQSSAEQSAACALCLLNKACDFYMKYGKNIQVTNLNRLGLNLRKLVHKDCPSYPDENLPDVVDKYAGYIEVVAANGTSVSLAPVGSLMGSTQGVLQGASLLKHAQNAAAASLNPALELDEDEAEALMAQDGLEHKESGLVDVDDIPTDLETSAEFKAGKGGGYYSAQHLVTTGIALQMNASTVESLSKTSVVAFMQLCKRLEEFALAHAEKRRERVDEVTDSTSMYKMKTLNEVPKLPINAYSLPDAVLDSKLAQRSLDVRVNDKPRDKQKVFYVLVDVSGSMLTFLGKIGGMPVSRAMVAQAFALAILAKVKAEKGVLFIRTFDDKPNPVLIQYDSASSSAQLQYDAAVAYMKNCSFSGGGTNIPLAILKAADDVSKASAINPLLYGCQISLMTDVEDHALVTQLKQLAPVMDKVVLNTLDLAPMDAYGADASKVSAVPAKAALQTISDSYHAASLDAASLEQMVVKMNTTKHLKNAPKQ